MNQDDKEMAFYQPTIDEQDMLDAIQAAHEGYLEWEEFVNGPKAASDALLKAGLMAVKIATEEGGE